jgi:hypothetical protein
MNAVEERYAVVLFPESRFLARWLRPVEAAAYVEAFNRLVQKPLRHARMLPEPAEKTLAARKSSSA